jgi:predicted XRE-type DNA-binding protein
MNTVFIAGSISISRLHEKVKSRIEKIVASDLDIVVGDADGADTSIQQCLVEYGAKRVTVFCSGDRPRNNLAEWPVTHIHPKAPPGSRAFYTAKDIEMAHASNYGLMVWDCKSTGTLSNVIQLIKEDKKSVVFVNKNKDFVTVADEEGLNYLLTFMSDHARTKAEEKIGLSSKIADISQKQFTLDVNDSELEQKSKKNAPHMAPRPYHETTSKRVVSGGEKSIANATNPVDGDSACAQNMKLRVILITAIERRVKAKGWTQAEAARLLGVTQPRVSDLLRHEVGVFGLDTLINMAAAAGLNIEMRVSDAV